MDASRLTVLVVDDTPSNIQLLVGMLSGAYRTKVATDGPGALKIAQKEPRPNLILLDVLMPEMDGYEVCRELKSNPDTAAIPVVFVTGTADEEDVRKGFSLGGDGFIMKPLDPRIVIETVKRAIRVPV